MKNKLKNQKGMTVLEVLSSLALIVIVLLIIGTGVGVASRTYSRTLRYSEAQSLCASLSTVINDECAFSTDDTEIVDGHIAKFGSKNFGRIESDFFVSKEGQIYLGDYPLLSKGLYTRNLNANVDITYDNNGCFKIVVKIYDDKNNLLADNTVVCKSYKNHNKSKTE